MRVHRMKYVIKPSLELIASSGPHQIYSFKKLLFQFYFGKTYQKKKKKKNHRFLKTALWCSHCKDTIGRAMSEALKRPNHWKCDKSFLSSPKLFLT